MRRNINDLEALKEISPLRQMKRGSSRNLMFALFSLAVLGMISLQWMLRPSSRPQLPQLTAWARGVSILDGVAHPKTDNLPGAWAGRSDEQPQPRDEWRVARHLIVVAGHSVYVGADRSKGALERESSWSLERYQRGQLPTMLAHIKVGVKLAAEDNASLLIFSGGATREAAGPRTEALSYWEAAEAQGWFGHGGVRARAHIEDQARDHSIS